MYRPLALDLFDAQCARTPDAEAVRFQDASLSYRGLADRSRALAETLVSLGVRPGEPVALHTERSIEHIVAILGVMRAGAVCLPLDVSYPRERLDYMCADASASLLLGSDGQPPLFADSLQLLSRDGIVFYGRGGGRELDRDRDRDRPAPQAANSARTPLPAISAEDTAYVVYTSGSTGRPKGVVYSHGSLANLITWQIQDSGCGAQDRTLQFSPSSFDVVFQETFSAIGSGGALVCCSDDERLDPIALLDLVERERVTRLFMPFAAVQLLALYGRDVSQETHPLREIMTAGEQVQVTDRVRDFFGKLPECRLANQWGTTETHVVTSHTLHARDIAGWPELPAIGKAIAECHIHVMGPDGTPVAGDEPGELWVSGTGVGEGYLGLPELTAAAFVDDPCCPGVRSYRTGDLGRLGDDGNLVFLGRMDRQVKVRGYRIELGEIETRLHSIPGVAEAAVITVGDMPASRYLFACVVPSAPGAVDVETITTELGRSLPEYMIPSRMVIADRLPRTPSGKIDRLAMASAAGPGAKSAAPATSATPAKASAAAA